MKFPKRKKEIEKLRKNLDITSTKNLDKGIKFYEKMARKSKEPLIYNELAEENKRIKDKFQRRLIEIDREFGTPNSREQKKKRLRTLLRR